MFSTSSNPFYFQSMKTVLTTLTLPPSLLYRWHALHVRWCGVVVKRYETDTWIYMKVGAEEEVRIYVGRVSNCTIATIHAHLKYTTTLTICSGECGTYVACMCAPPHIRSCGNIDNILTYVLLIKLHPTHSKQKRKKRSNAVSWCRTGWFFL